MCFFGMEITTADASFNRKQDLEKFLARMEAGKEAKHLGACKKCRHDFMPLCFTVNRMAGEEATAAMKRIYCLLATQWQRLKSKMVGYVTAPMQLAVMRANTLLLR